MCMHCVDLFKSTRPTSDLLGLSAYTYSVGGSRTKSQWTKTHRTISKRTKSQEDKTPGGQKPRGTKAQGDKIQVRQKPRVTKAQGDKTPQGQKPMEDNIPGYRISGGQNPKIFPRITLPPAVGFIYTRSTTWTSLPICVSPVRPAGPVKPLQSGL